VTSRKDALVVALVFAAVLSAGCVGPFGGQSTPTPAPTATETAEIHSSYQQTTVTVFDGETGEELGRVEAAVADNRSLRDTGLSETDSMPDDRGMLFTYDAERELTYVMRNMSFGLDIVFVRADGTIESIHHAPEPGPDEDGENQRYSGEGRYVLEVNRNWTTDRGIEEGDRVEFDLPE